MPVGNWNKEGAGTGLGNCSITLVRPLSYLERDRSAWIYPLLWSVVESFLVFLVGEPFEYDYEQVCLV